MIKQVHVYIKGDVVGVGFRAWTKIQAMMIGVNGWVRNADHQTVEVTIQGEEEKVNKMIDLVKQGPPVSRVDDVEIHWEEPKWVFEKFEIRNENINFS